MCWFTEVVTFKRWQTYFQNLEIFRSNKPLKIHDHVSICSTRISIIISSTLLHQVSCGQLIHTIYDGQMLTGLCTHSVINQTWVHKKTTSQIKTKWNKEEEERKLHKYLTKLLCNTYSYIGYMKKRFNSATRLPCNIFNKQRWLHS